MADFEEKVAPQFNPALHAHSAGDTLPHLETKLSKEASDLSDKAAAPTAEEIALAEKDSKYLTGWPLALVFIGMLLSIFLIALDQTILAPALPVIASKFDALESLAWIASSYFLTQSALLLLYGQILTLFDRKWTFIVAIAWFELGSLICGVARSIDVVILGRAISGVGAAGIFVSCLSIIAEVTRLEDRPRLFGLFGAVFAVSSVLGPILGGAFTDHASWRWCFFINLPFGAISIIALVFILGPQPPAPMSEEIAVYTEQKFQRYFRGRWQPARTSIAFRAFALDWIGSILMLGVMTCLLIALQDGGVKYPWSDGRIIGLFCAFGALAIIFGIWEWKFAGKSTIFPFRLFKSRTQVGAMLSSFMVMFAMLVGTYWIPTLFQAMQGVSATKSGIKLLPFMLSIVVSAGVGGFVVSATGRYWHIITFAPIFTCVGAGLLYTLNESSNNGKLIGYQIIFAIGIGAVMQNCIIAVQATVKDEVDVAQATALVTFSQLVGGTIGLSISSALFNNQLSKNMREFAPNAPAIVLSSVTAIRAKAPIEEQAGIIHAYVKALDVVFLVGVGAGFFCIVAGFIMKNVSIKGKTLAPGGA